MPVSTIQRFQRFFAATSDCQFYVKPDERGNFRYLHVNPAAIAVTGCSVESDLIGLTPVEAMGEEYGGTVEQNITRCYQNGEPYHFRGALGQTADAPVYDALYIPLKDQEGTVAGVLGSARNISEISLLNERLLHAQRLEALGELAGSVAHDFNNVLTIFQAALRFLARDNLDPAQKKMVADEATKALNNGIALTRRLTAFARKEKIHAVGCDVQELVSSCLMMVQRILGKRTKLDFCPEPDLWKACCDRNEFEIALMNIASNARDAMDTAGHVTISARNAIRKPSDPRTYPSEYVEITVKDNGKGMPPDIWKKLRNHFSQQSQKAMEPGWD